MAAAGPLRWGLIGSGGIADTFASDLALTGSGRVVAVGSRSQAAAARFGDKFDIANRHASYEELVNDPEVDVVYVATPHPMHHPNALLALHAGKPVLVEKPFTTNAGEARELVETARSRGLFLMEAMWTRFLPHIAEIRRLLADGALGELVSVTADHGQWFPKEPDLRLFAPALGGGALLDLGVYPVSFASMVLGRPDRIVALVDPTFTGVDGQTSMLFGYARGAQAILTCTLGAKSPTRAAIVGTDARIEIDGDFYAPSSFTVISRDGSTTRFAQPHEGRGLRHQADEVARCLRGGLLESPLMPLDESVAIMETMDAVLAQARGEQDGSPMTDDGADLDALVLELEEQERRLWFTHFDDDDAWALGNLVARRARERRLPVTIDIRRHGQQLFHAALPGTTAENDSWIERKIRVVDRFDASSLLVGRRLASKGEALDQSYGVDPVLYAAHGGSFPIRIRDVGLVGTVTVSGLPQADDHALVVGAVEELLSGES